MQYLFNFNFKTLQNKTIHNLLLLINFPFSLSLFYFFLRKGKELKKRNGRRRYRVGLARATELRLKISNCIHKANDPPPKRENGIQADGEAGDEDREEEEEDDEAHKLFNICDALESLENQLSSLQALQQQQRYEREVALSEMESSRKMLLNKLKEYKGNDLEVIHEASAFAGETVEHNNDLLLPPYPSRSPHTFCLENGYLPPTHKSLRNGIINSDPTNEEKKKLSETDRDEVKTGSKNSRGLGFVLSTAAKTVLTIVGVASVLSLSGFGPRFVRSNTTFKISGLSQHHRVRKRD
ncbi:plastid division2 [Prunus dulcis]|uniref:Plastid division2 n=1 Tax=Prunus dulcis TaxID=3755 RepID=A0A4Y1RYH0_PRUDU|nr:plastid division2 [Prunus dulcis]